MSLKPGDRMDVLCGCVNQWDGQTWHCVAPCVDHAAYLASLHQHSWACETCPMGPFDDEAMRAILSAPPVPGSSDRTED